MTMSRKVFVVHFGLFFLPFLVVCTLVYVVYSLQVHEYVTIDWKVVLGLTVALDAFVAWRQARKEMKGKGPDQPQP